MLRGVRDPGGPSEEDGLIGRLQDDVKCAGFTQHTQQDRVTAPRSGNGGKVFSERRGFYAVHLFDQVALAQSFGMSQAVRLDSHNQDAFRLSKLEFFGEAWRQFLNFNSKFYFPSCVRSRGHGC